MIQFLDVSEENTIAARVVGKIETEDVEKAAKEIDRRLEEDGKVNMYIELDHFEGYEPKAFLEELKLTTEHFGDFRKMAIVSQEEWLNTLAEITDKISPQLEARYYRLEERPQALRWLEE